MNVHLAAPEAFTPDKADRLWERIRGLEQCFDDFSFGRGDMFAARLLQPDALVFEVEDSALVLVEHIIPRLGADIHFFSWKPMEFRAMVAAGQEVLEVAF